MSQLFNGGNGGARCDGCGSTIYLHRKLIASQLIHVHGAGRDLHFCGVECVADGATEPGRDPFTRATLQAIFSRLNERPMSRAVIDVRLERCVPGTSPDTHLSFTIDTSPIWHTVPERFSEYVHEVRVSVHGPLTFVYAHLSIKRLALDSQPQIEDGELVMRVSTDSKLWETWPDAPGHVELRVFVGHDTSVVHASAAGGRYALTALIVRDNADCIGETVPRSRFMPRPLRAEVDS